jgi:hypothetical protein
MHGHPVQGIRGAKAPKPENGKSRLSSRPGARIAELSEQYVALRNQAQPAKAEAAETALAEKKGTLISRRLVQARTYDFSPAVSRRREYRPLAGRPKLLTQKAFDRGSHQGGCLRPLAVWPICRARSRTGIARSTATCATGEGAPTASARASWLPRQNRNSPREKAAAQRGGGAPSQGAKAISKAFFNHGIRRVVPIEHVSPHTRIRARSSSSGLKDSPSGKSKSFRVAVDPCFKFAISRQPRQITRLSGGGALLPTAALLSSPAQLALHHISVIVAISRGRSPSIRSYSASQSWNGRPSRTSAPGSPAAPCSCI